MFTAALSHESNDFSNKQHYARQEQAAQINGKPFKLRHEFNLSNGLYADLNTITTSAK
jgi:hypothetical protein